MSQLGPEGGAEAGVIHDIGFRHYAGPRLGRAYLLRSLYVESLRGAYGLGRSGKSKVLPFLMLAAMTFPALVIAVVAGVNNQTHLPLPYTRYAVTLQTLIVVFLAAQSPAMVSRDLRFRVMPLYFSRPLERSDYVLAKYAAMASALWILISLPLTVLFGGALLAKMAFWEQARGYLAGLAGALVFALVFAGIGLLIASITPRRGFGVAAVITVLLLLTVFSATVTGLASNQGHRSLAGYLGLIAPWSLVDGVQVWVLRASTSAIVGPPRGPTAGIVFVLVTLAVIIGSYLLMQVRYRRVSGS